MSPEEQRIAIAEACGYEFKDESSRYPEDEDWQKHKAVYRNGGFIGLSKPDWLQVPDYCSDLNACHSMEKVLDDSVDRQESDLLKYYRILSDICSDYPGSYVQSATASQRCEAFLRTLNLWKDQP